MKDTKIKALALLLLVMSVPAAAQRGILYASPDHTLVSFIPESLLADFDWSKPEKVDLSNLPIKASYADLLRSLVAEKSKSTKGEPCSRYGLTSGTDLIGKPVISDHLEDVVRSSEVAFTGRISRKMTGLVPGAWTPQTRVFMEIEEVLHDSSEELAPGQEWSYVIQYGKVRLGKAFICHEPPSDKFIPEVDGKVLFIGNFDSVNLGENLHYRVVFELSAGMVLPQSNLFWTSSTPISVSALRQALGPKKEESRQ